MPATLKSTQKRVLVPSSGLDYAFLDSGNHRKLERFGSVILNRPEISADWKPNLSKQTWANAHWYFYEETGKKGNWRPLNPAPTEWKIEYKISDLSLFFELQLTAFKHVGIFPEQAANWQYIHEKIKSLEKPQPKILNLFAYTGIASIVAAKSGAEVFNIDSVKQVISWSKKNAYLNQENNIHWLIEDARKYVKKCLNKGIRFDGIIMDPPSFGHGGKKEMWKIERDLPLLLAESMNILSSKNRFFILNTYSPKFTLDSLKTLVNKTPHFPKHFESTLLGLKSSTKQQLVLGNLIRFSS